GTYTIAATFAGSSNYLPAASTATITINPATPVVTVSGGTFTFDGLSHAATGAVTGVGGASLGLPALTYTDSTNAISSTPPVNAGTYTVAARFGGNNNYLPAANTT